MADIIPANKKLSLPSIPTDEFYEDYVAAVLSIGGLFIERRLILNHPINILELDVVTTRLKQDTVEKTLSEIKSAGWGLTDVFKVRGWLDYLKYEKASFVSLDSPNGRNAEYQQIAETLSIRLIDVQKQDVDKLDETPLRQAYDIVQIDKKVYDCAFPMLRYAYCLERLMVERYLKPLAKDPHGLQAYKELQQYINIIHDYTFFENDTHKRLMSVFQAFVDYRNITARLETEMRTGTYEDYEHSNLSEEAFAELFYGIPPQQNPLHIALYAELYNRLIMLKLVIEEVIRDKNLTSLMKTIHRLSLPNNIKTGIDEMREQPHFYLYPSLWQSFVFVMGGFLLKDKLDDEYHILSELSGVPIDEVSEGLRAFDMLFPLDKGGWFIDKPKTSIRILQFMPLPFSGIGANFRRCYYRTDDLHCDYNDLGNKLTGKYTISDLIKFNDLAVEYLSKAKELIVK